MNESNRKVKVEVKPLEKLAHEITVAVDAETVNRKLEGKFGQVRRDVQLKGFRRGKAPMGMIKEIYGGDVRAEVAEEVLKETLSGAIEESALKVATRPTLMALDFNEGGGIDYSVKVEILPEIGSIGIDGLKVTEEGTEVTDQEVDELAESLRNAFVEHRPVQREVIKGDRVILDLDKLEDPDNVLEDDHFEDAEVDLANPMTVRELKDELPGMKTGDSKEIEVNYSNDYPDPSFAGKRIRYRATVKEVQERILPEWDDAFAKRTKQAETALELKLRLRDDIKQNKEGHRKRVQRNQIVRQMCERNQLEMPEALVDDYLSAVIEDAKRQQPDLNEDEARLRYRVTALNTLRWNMIYHHLAEQEKVEISAADTDEFFKRFAAEYQMTPEQAAEALKRSGKMETLQDTVLEEKVLDLLIGRAQVVDTLD
jgi:trigger factor